MCALVDSWLPGLKKAPVLESERLELRPLCVGDVEHIQRSINDKRVCDNLSYTPNPYTLEMAESWVRSVNYGMLNDNCCYWTICDLKTGRFIGSIGISVYKEQEGGELHYWVSAEEWNKGYCTEASKRTIVHFFEDLKLHRLAVTHREWNIASKRIVQKCGFVFEGNLRDSLKRFEKFENVFSYSMLDNEYLALKKKGVY
ncbi:MAG: GNAT family N-acetyltransferase [Puniceicoccales bacterium]|jgi:RimJ/RimL family protein N-acetyltransferase|nr:GNAT family N-acetyltransferase [Puniceicoccales bacterium]